MSEAWSINHWSRPIHSPTNVFASFLVGFVLLGGGCSSDTSAPKSPGIHGEITVSAAASLTEAFTALAKDFEAKNPGTQVVLTFDSSSTLSAQIVEGAPANVFASADQANMTKLAGKGLLAGTPAVFARNQLAVITKPGNPEQINSLADLAHAGVISLCGQDVPCGTFAAQALAAAGVTIKESAVTRGQNAKATLNAVTEGDAVAGIVYATDALAAGNRVHVVNIPASQNVIADYPIAVLAPAAKQTAASQAMAKAFKSFVLSRAAAKRLKEFGFLPPA